MYFNKSHQPENFAYPNEGKIGPRSMRIGGDSFGYRLQHLGGGVHRYDVEHARWPVQHSEAELNVPLDHAAIGSASITKGRGLSIGDGKGRELLVSQPGRCFGVCGQAWMMCFDYDPAMRFYGLGEKWTGLEHSHKHTKFWNTDVWADFAPDVYTNGSPDPAYLSIPYLIIKRGNRYCGILINNPYAVFVSTNPKIEIAQQAEAGEKNDTRLFIGSPDGRPEVYFIVGPTLAEVTRKLQGLVGTTPRPPLWALGHQQCRWGYAGYDDLDHVDKQFRKHKIPNDGLWLDIDYMTGYRVFTWDKKHWPDADRQVAELQSRGQHVVPIFDPGVKRDPAYHAYQSGNKQDVFCKNPAGGAFVGFVWPGKTVFPDYSLPEGRSWWAGQVEKAVSPKGISGAWLDMNDPATGLSENSEMLFRHGTLEHAAYHNQYALGMAKATHQGMLDAHPDKRPFLLTRSGFISTNRYAAAWTGDNVSNTHHLKNCIPTTLNLALSGLPFNGPDVPGFGGNATPELAIAWYKACCLFPFLRNHCHQGLRDQEPWAFGVKTMRVIRRYIRLRYKLLPYLYNLFIQQEQTGEAILRPLLYDFNDTRALPLDRIDDQFMVGPSLMQAPLLNERDAARQVVLPKGQWLDAMSGRWIEGGRKMRVKCDDQSTPMYLRDGSIIPMRVGDPTDNATDLNNIELHLFISPRFKGTARYTYTADRGEGFGYRRGEQTTVEFTARRRDGQLLINAKGVFNAKGPLNVRLMVRSAERNVRLKAGGRAQQIQFEQTRFSLTGKEIASKRSAVIQLGG